jgi:hypothetical protein
MEPAPVLILREVRQTSEVSCGWQIGRTDLQCVLFCGGPHFSAGLYRFRFRTAVTFKLSHYPPISRIDTEWPISTTGKAYTVHPLIGGGVAEWLKAAVC